MTAVPNMGDQYWLNVYDSDCRGRRALRHGASHRRLVSITVALADKLDTLAGFFAIVSRRIS